MSLPMEADGWRRIFIGSAVDVDIDAGSRIHISPELRRDAGLVRDVLLIGVGPRLELWDTARYASHESAVKQSPMPDAVKSFVF
jgi:MraZ protein